MSAITDGISRDSISPGSATLDSVSETFLTAEANKTKFSLDNIISSNLSFGTLNTSADPNSTSGSFAKSIDFAAEGVLAGVHVSDKENIRPQTFPLAVIPESSPVKIKADFIDASEHVTVTGHRGACSPFDLANKLFSTNEFPIEQIAKILSRNDAYHLETCKEYMNNFKFEGLRLDQALRMLMEKLPLVGETSSIERLLRCFSKRYWLCNQNVEDLNADSWQILTCSLMILNNDLYSTVKAKKMTEKEYVSNTMDCFDENTPKPSVNILKNLYRGIKASKLPVFQMKPKQLPKSRQASIEEEPDDVFEPVKSTPLYYTLSTKPKTYFQALTSRNSWSLAHVTLVGLKLIIHPKKDDISKGALVFSLAHSFTDCTYSNSNVKFKFVVHLQDDRKLKFFDLKYENVVDWVMCLNSACAMLSTPHLGYGVGNPPIYKKMSMHPQAVYKGKIVDLLNKWMQRYKEITEILERNIAYKPSSREKKIMETSIKACILERTRLLKYINTIRSYEIDYLQKFIHPANPDGLEGLKEHVDNLREISRQGGKIF